MVTPSRSALGRLVAALPRNWPLVRQLRALVTARRTATEALRLATEASRAVECLLQSELELKRELASLRQSRSELVR